MIEKIIAYCSRNKFPVLALTLFGVIAGWWAINHISLDAIPDLTDTQVIVYTKWEGRSPDLVEDQITYPIVSALVSTPGVKTVRGISDLGFSYIYVIFDEGTDIYWARSRVLEYLQQIGGKLPPGVSPALGPDATGLGWVYEYALVDRTGSYDLGYLRTLQDWYLRFELSSVEGVAEVASVGGFVKQYQVNLDPNKLVAYNLAIRDVIMKIQASNRDVDGRVLEFSGREYMVRGRGYLKSISDLQQVVVGVSPNSTPVLLGDVASVVTGSDLRRGIVELNGEGEVVGGIVVMRTGENALAVIDRVKARIESVKNSLPKGVEIVTTYDRSELVKRAISTLKQKLIEEGVIVSLVSILFLYHFRSALVAILMLPIAILLAFIPMFFMRVTANIMSLGGIAIAIGAMVDAAIVMIENAHKQLERAGPGADRKEVIIRANQQVGRPLFFSLLVITVSFLPVFVLEAQEGRLFRPLAFTKVFAMFFAALLSVSLVPAIMDFFVRGKITPEAKNPVTRGLIRLYHPLVEKVLAHRGATVAIAGAILLVSAVCWFVFPRHSEFMPPLNEGTILYMPVTSPGISVTEAGRLLQVQDKILKGFPEVQSVFGKSGRAETATDPAPFSMMETTIVLKPKSEWRKGMTPEKLIAEMTQALTLPGVSNAGAFTMPIKARVDMLSTGIRSPLGIKLAGPDLGMLQHLGKYISMALSEVKGTKSVFAEKAAEGYYVDININREAIARYGLTIDDVEEVIQSAIGGMNITTTIEGRERYPVNVRLNREFRDDIERLKRVQVPAGGGRFIPLEQLAEIKQTTGPAMIRDEDGFPTSYIYVDAGGRDIADYVKEANAKIAEHMQMPTGYTLTWTGQFENLERVKKRLIMVIPLVLLLVFLLLYFNKKSVPEVLIVLLAVPFSLVGAIWILYILDYNLSVAVWVGIIALLGVDAETGVVMLIYLDESYNRHKSEGRLSSLADLSRAVSEGAVQRIRPKIMTVAAIALGLLPIMWSQGTGAEVMKRIAAPMIGGILTSALMELLVYPAIYSLWKEKSISGTGHSA
ncbi:MAG: CusA/CzcA family heavy metal efflux RND transporter [bacterium]|nr:CusA/CzcA family heavy metal efflux RND transporter [bacterium]